MKMFKKLMAVALVGVMALSMLTGCAVSDAIAEKQAEKGLENAYKTVTGVDVNFKQTNADAFTNAKKAVRDSIKDKELVTDKAVLADATKNFTIVVVPEPKNPTKEDSWKNTAVKVITAAESSTVNEGIYLHGTNDLTAKVNITSVEGVDAKGKKETYYIFVFAASEAAYNK